MVVVALLLVVFVIIAGSFAIQKGKKYKDKNFFSTTALFYKSNEWVRWVLFIPLTLVCTSIVTIFVAIVCSLMPRNFYKALIQPVASGSFLILFADIFAPRQILKHGQGMVGV